MKNIKETEEEILGKTILRNAEKKIKLKAAARFKRWKFLIIWLLFYIFALAPIFYFQFAIIDKESMSPTLLLSVLLFPSISIFILIAVLAEIINRRLDAINELMEIKEEDDNKGVSL